MRYEPVPSDVEKFCDNVRYARFPELEGINILYIFDNKKSTSNGKITIAKIKKMNDEMKFLAMANSGLTYEYAIYIDKSIWFNLTDSDKERVIFHEFCHCDVDFEKKNPYGLRGHEIEGFYDEIEDDNDLKWKERVALIAEHVYEKD